MKTEYKEARGMAYARGKYGREQMASPSLRRRTANRREIIFARRRALTNINVTVSRNALQATVSGRGKA
jgi:hypothetical protein